VAKLNKAVDDVRRAETKRLHQEGYEDALKHTKYCFLKNEENLTDKQKLRLEDVLQLDLKSVRAYLLKQSFQLFWQYNAPYWARWYLQKWCTRAMRSKLDPVKKFVKTVRRHEDLMMTIVSLPRERFYDIPVKNRLANATADSFFPDPATELHDTSVHAVPSLPQ